MTTLCGTLLCEAPPIFIRLKLNERHVIGRDAPLPGPGTPIPPAYTFISELYTGPLSALFSS